MSIRQTISDRPWILAALVTLLVVAWLASGQLGREPAGPAPAAATGPAEDEIRVQVQTQNAQPITRYISVYGRSAPARRVELKAETDGRIEAILAERGERVSKGQPIIRLDLRDRRARLEQAQASVTEHQTAYEAQQRLKEASYVSETQIAETLAKLEAARAELTRAKLDLEYMTIRAPFDGVIQEREVEIGDFISKGDPVGTFVDNTRLIVTGTIAEQDVRYVEMGAKADAVLVTGQSVQGRIRYVAPVADEATRTFTVELEVPNPDGSLPAGVTAELKIAGGEMLAQKVSPALLTLDAAGNIGVKTVNNYNQVVFHPIEIARSDADGVWVAGLPETANVIVLGQGYVNAGREVDPVFVDAETALAADKMTP